MSYSLVYSVEVLYPEAIYECALLTYLMAKRGGVRKTNSRLSPHAELMVNPAFARVTLYQSLVLEAIRREATPGRMARIQEYLSQSQAGLPFLYTQWIDVLNADYIHMTRKRRAESLSTIVRDIVEWDRNDQCLEMRSDIAAYAEDHHCSIDNVRLACESAYEEELVW